MSKLDDHTRDAGRAQATQGNFRVSICFLGFALLLCCVGWIYVDAAQSSFEVASVKIMPPGPNQTSIVTTPGRFTATRVTIRRLIRWAYEVQDFQILKSPEWRKEMDLVFAEGYEIIAKADGSANARQMRVLVQELLKERFRLVMHTETREMAVYALIVDSGGPKLRPVTSREEGISHIKASMDDEAVELTFPSGATMMQLANFLSAQRSIGKPVIERTGLEGVFEFRLRWQPIDGITYVDTVYNASTGPPPPPAPPSGGERPSGPPLIEAVRKQLGLRLKSENAPVNVLVIDHLALPTAN